jgi:chromosome segregation ATPase
MNENARTVITDFENKLHRLVHEYRTKVEQNDELSRKIEEKENMLHELQLRCTDLENSYNNLKQAKVISISDAGVDGVKEKISRLVREIDRCIESLKKE